MLIEDLSFSLPPNGGIVGAHRAERRGQAHSRCLQDDRGRGAAGAGASIRIGETVQIAYMDQSCCRIDPDKNVWEAISGTARPTSGRGRSEIPSRAYVAAFVWPKGADYKKPAGDPVQRRAQPPTSRSPSSRAATCCCWIEPINRPGRRNVLSLAAKNALLELPRPRGDNEPRPAGSWDRIATHIHGLGGRVELVLLVRGELRVVREEQDRSPGGRGRPAAPGDLPEASTRGRAAWPETARKEPHA